MAQWYSDSLFMFGNNTNRPGNGHSKETTHNNLVAGVVIKGDLRCSSDLRIDGKLEGDLIGEAKVVLGPQAELKGSIRGQHIVVEGNVEGNIVAEERLYIKSTGIVKGDIVTHKLIIEDGATFNGASITGKIPTSMSKDGSTT